MLSIRIINKSIGVRFSTSMLKPSGSVLHGAVYKLKNTSFFQDFFVFDYFLIGKAPANHLGRNTTDYTIGRYIFGYNCPGSNDTAAI